MSACGLIYTLNSTKQLLSSIINALPKLSKNWYIFFPNFATRGTSGTYIALPGYHIWIYHYPNSTAGDKLSNCIKPDCRQTLFTYFTQRSDTFYPHSVKNYRTCREKPIIIIGYLRIIGYSPTLKTSIS